MNAVDPNILARFLLRDDPVQSPAAAAIMADGVVISPTVLMETAWLLRSRSRQPHTVIATATATATALRTVALPGVIGDGMASLSWAPDRYEAGADIADVAHLVAARDMTAFATFDRAIARIADPPVPVAIPG